MPRSRRHDRRVRPSKSELRRQRSRREKAKKWRTDCAPLTMNTRSAWASQRRKLSTTVKASLATQKYFFREVSIRAPSREFQQWYSDKVMRARTYRSKNTAIVLRRKGWLQW